MALTETEMNKMKDTPRNDLEGNVRMEQILYPKPTTCFSRFSASLQCVYSSSFILFFPSKW